MDSDLLRFNKDKKILLLDCETQNLGLNVRWNLPWQISLLKIQGDKIIDHKDMYLKWNPPLFVCKGAANKTGFDQKKIDSIGIPPEKAFEFLDPWLRDCDYVMGHNILGFDYYVIRSLYEKLGKEKYNFLYKLIDTLCLVKGMKLGYPLKKGENLLAYQYKSLNLFKKGVKNSLGALGKEYGIEHNYESLHDALSDLQLNLKVWNHLKYQIEI